MHLPSPEAVSSLSGSPVPRSLAPPLTLGGLPTPSSTAPLLKAAADVVRERGRTQVTALGDKQAGHCNRRTGGGSNCPLR